MTSLAMMGLISTPSTWRGAEDERGHQVAAAAGTDDERARSPGSLRAGTPARSARTAGTGRSSRLRLEWRIGVEAAESMSMNRVSGTGPV